MYCKDKQKLRRGSFWILPFTRRNIKLYYFKQLTDNNKMFINYNLQPLFLEGNYVYYCMYVNIADP